MSEEKRHILVVDDDVQLVDSVTTLLESVGYSVSYAYHPEKALDLAKETRPDLILLDIMFAGPPGPDGVEVSRQIHRDPEIQDIPVIMLSGVKKVLDMPVHLAHDEDYMPVKAFLEKPFEPEQLLAEVEKVLGSL
ncbi:MAG: response regulator [Anaerolineae bacterium]|nr:response regulator [Anaerolineae bacterium]